MSPSARSTTGARSTASNRSTTVAGLFGFGLFAAILVLVQLGLLAGVDMAAMQAKQAVVSDLLDTWSALVGIVLAAELSAIYACVAVLLLWRAGLGWWSLAPLCWMLLVPLEMALKSTIDQQRLPSEFYRGVYYPLTTVSLKGSFPSGHAMRTGFLCAFAAVFVWHRLGPRRLVALGFIPLALLMGFARVYLGYHWLSDVVAGLALGAGLALILAPRVVERLARWFVPLPSFQGPDPDTARSACRPGHASAPCECPIPNDPAAS